MKYFIQFLHVRDNKLYENLGSDGVFILDGRNNLQTMKCDAQARIHTLRNIAKIDGYRIMQGNKFSNATQLYEWVRSGARQL